MRISTKRIVSLAALLLLGCATWPAQTPETASKFEFADVHPAAKPASAANQYMRIGSVRNGRYQLHTASLLDLIRFAWGYDADNILGGPPSIDIRRFEIGARVANGTPPETLKLMLRMLLENRFALKVHQDTKQLPGYVLTSGKKPNLKRADGSGETGCRLVRPTADSTAGGRGVVALNGEAVAFGPSLLVHYACDNVTMGAFAASLRTMFGSRVGTSFVKDETGLEGAWNFDVRWSLALDANAQGENVSAAEAIEKQLGLKLEQRPVPTPVLVVDSANDDPAPNPPGTAQALPPIPPPTAFEVADIRPTGPDFRGSSFRIQNGRFTVEGMPMMFLLSRALDAVNNNQIAGLAGDFNSLRFNINAKLPADVDPDMDISSMGLLIRNLLIDRFRMKYHTEERPQTVYRLTAVKSKMKQADPNSRIGCKTVNAPAGSPRGTVELRCQNTSMEQFVVQLRNSAPQFSWPVMDGTGLQGGWDFNLTFNRLAGMNVGGGGRGGESAANGIQAGVADDPGGGVTVFDAVEKQLGLKLEAAKRPMPMYVIDHIETTPTEN